MKHDLKMNTNMSGTQYEYMWNIFIRNEICSDTFIKYKTRARYHIKVTQI